MLPERRHRAARGRGPGAGTALVGFLHHTARPISPQFAHPPSVQAHFTTIRIAGLALPVSSDRKLAGLFSRVADREVDNPYSTPQISGSRQSGDRAILSGIRVQRLSRSFPSLLRTAKR